MRHQGVENLGAHQLHQRDEQLRTDLKGLEHDLALHGQTAVCVHEMAVELVHGRQHKLYGCLRAHSHAAGYEQPHQIQVHRAAPIELNDLQHLLKGLDLLVQRTVGQVHLWDGQREDKEDVRNAHVRPFRSLQIVFAHRVRRQTRQQATEHLDHLHEGRHNAREAVA